MSSPITSHPPPATHSNNDVLVRVDGVSKKFCRSLKKSLWYGVCDIGAELNPFRRQIEGNGARVTGSELRVAGNQSAKGGGNQLATSYQSHGTGEARIRPGEFWAVNDVSFELRRGECLGLIGHNGAGKTTLLKMLNGLIKPDEGSITMRGRVGALIALGAGFNPILTGRENIYINGSILGLSKREIDGKLDDIIDFAEIGDFIDTPVQNYSSGMQVRLGFAVASSLSPDVLILDEVLAVGDVGFVIKCLNRMREIQARAAVIFVSHNMQLVTQFCTRVIVMDCGRACCDSEAIGEGIDKYLSFFHRSVIISGPGKAQIENVSLSSDGLTWNDGDEASIIQGARLMMSFDLVGSSLAGRAVRLSGAVKDNGVDAVMALPPRRECADAVILKAERTRINFELDNVMLNSSKYVFVIYVNDAATGASLARIEGIAPFRIRADVVHWGRWVSPIMITANPKYAMDAIHGNDGDGGVVQC